MRKDTDKKVILEDGQDTEMKQRTGTLCGFPAQLVQHAIDHCNGILV